MMMTIMVMILNTIIIITITINIIITIIIPYISAMMLCRCSSFFLRAGCTQQL